MKLDWTVQGPITYAVSPFTNVYYVIAYDRGGCITCTAIGYRNFVVKSREQDCKTWAAQFDRKIQKKGGLV